MTEQCHTVIQLSLKQLLK